ncbi:MAG: nuclear transport factor 2 family protein [Frankiaceae bacterium]|nr:nuclear transport factor 2 family protein [Frankiaceae bacterium]
MTVSLDPWGDQWEIRQLIERYANGADRADGEAVAELFADDAELVVWLDPRDAKPTSTRRGPAEIATAISWMERYHATQHVISNSVVDIDGDTARGDTRCTAHHVQDQDNDQGPEDRILFIRYSDDFVRVDGSWRFSRRELRVQWISTRRVEAM